MLKKLIGLFKKKTVEVKEETSQDVATLIPYDDAVLISKFIDEMTANQEHMRKEWDKESERLTDIGDIEASVKKDYDNIGDLIIGDRKSEDSRLPVLKPKKSSKKKSKKNKKRKKKK